MYSAQYGDSNAYYGNIQLGQWSPIPAVYGAWPQDVPANSPMLNWQDPEIVEIKVDPKPSIEIIRKLKAELADAKDLQERQALREKIEVARQEKVKAFQLAARTEREEEESFMLLH